MFEKSVFCIACGTDLPVHAKFCFGCGAPLRPQRRPISEKLRFEVFQRDGFTCQYCGRKPPEVTLHVDHKVPVAKGGSNHSDNLVSSCVECNLGKGVTQLDVEPASQWLDEQERRRKNAELKELRRTQASIKRMEKRFEAEIENLQDPNDFYFPG
ncbi:MAG TPA: HNH endonuclease, partial [Thermomicrobiales bacterium]|nr:HNH endonuclease [Thermomicrobiales bacterium]